MWLISALIFPSLFFQFFLLGALEQIKVDTSGIPEEKQVTKIT